jgi:site-specific recombinase XerD
MDKNTLRIVSKEFYKYLDAEKGAAFNTKRAYKGDVEDFLDFVEKSSFEVIDHQVIRHI